MHDLKNILLAWLSAAPTFMAVDQGNIFTIVSAIVLPTIFFLLGKAVDVGVQVYFRNRHKKLIGEMCADLPSKEWKCLPRMNADHTDKEK